MGAQWKDREHQPEPGSFSTDEHESCLILKGPPNALARDSSSLVLSSKGKRIINKLPEYYGDQVLGKNQASPRHKPWNMPTRTAQPPKNSKKEWGEKKGNRITSWTGRDNRRGVLGSLFQIRLLDKSAAAACLRMNPRLQLKERMPEEPIVPDRSA